MNIGRTCFYIMTALLCFLTVQVRGQKTGLVLSGGGAKGIAHIGVIRALEENNVRIDYISGTSIGAIVGSLYAMGYTTEEMMDLFKSEEFGRWKTGEIEAKYLFSSKGYFETPAILNIPIVSDEDRTKPQMPSYLIPSQVMDFAFMELTCGANAVSKRNFDSLMVPFRSVAADIYNKKPVVFRKGNLSYAVRSSMTYPIYFEPISVDSTLLFDGGIYNNFPFDVLVEDFQPEFIIGSKVSSRSRKPEQDNLMTQLENMIMQPTNFDIPDSLGLVVESNFVDVNLLDFEKADSLFLIGYKSALKMMPQILERAEFISDDELRMKREKFRNSLPELKFRGIEISGVGPQQEDYIRKLISKEEEEFDIDQLKSEYFRLVSEENIKNAYPEAIYNTETGTYDLLLDIKLKSAYNLSAGGLLSFTSYNQGFLQFDYYKLSDIFNRFSTNMYFGRYYSSFRIAHRIEIPKRKSTLVDLSLTENRWNYYSNDITSLFDAYFPSYILRRETAVQASAGRTLNNFTTIKGGLFLGWVRDNYFQDISLVEVSDPDITQYLNGSLKVELLSKRLNRKQFATSGSFFAASASLNSGYEYFDAANNDTLRLEEDQGFGHTWYALRLKSENYIRISQRFTLGTLLDLTASNKPFSSNYTASLINSYSFRPSDFTNLIYGESLRANSYLAGGLRPLLLINNSFSIRTGLYAFAPLFTIENSAGQAVKGDPFKEIRMIGEIGAVYQTPIGPISIGANFFSHERRRAYYYLNFGYILFNKSGLD